MLLFGCSEVFLVVGVRHHQRRQLANCIRLSKGWSVWSVPETNTDKCVSILLQYILTLFVLIHSLSHTRNPDTPPVPPRNLVGMITARNLHCPKSDMLSVSRVSWTVLRLNSFEVFQLRFFYSKLFVSWLSTTNYGGGVGAGRNYNFTSQTTFSSSVPVSFDV